MYNDHPWDPKIVAAVDRWSLFRGLIKFNLGLQNGGRYRQEVVIRRWLLAQVWLYFENILDGSDKSEKEKYFRKFCIT